MKNIKINAFKVSNTTAKEIRTEDMIPAIVYGPQHQASQVKIDALSFKKLTRTVRGSTIIDLDIEGENVPVLIHDIQKHPVSGDIVHVDFYALNINKPVIVTLRLKFEGDPEGVRLNAGVLVTERNEISIRCLPKDLIESITLDLNVLKEIGSSIHIKDIPVPEGIEIVDNGDLTVVHIVAPKLVVETEEEVEGEEGELVEGEEGGEATEGEEDKESGDNKEA